MRLQFQLNQAEEEKIKDFQELLKAKTKTKKDILRKIDRFSKQENIIIKVLDIINNQENQALFEEKDSEINMKFQDINELWEVKREELEKYKRIKEVQEDIDYFADHALY